MEALNDMVWNRVVKPQQLPRRLGQNPSRLKSPEVNFLIHEIKINKGPSILILNPHPILDIAEICSEKSVHSLIQHITTMAINT